MYNFANRYESKRFDHSDILLFNTSLVNMTEC